MHDLNYFREHLAEFEQMAANRGARIDFDAFRALDRERRERITAGERLKAERNRASEEIARRKRAGESADDLLAEMKRVSEEIKLADEAIAAFDTRPARLHAVRAEPAALVGSRGPRRNPRTSKSAVGALRRNSISLPSPHWEVGGECRHSGSRARRKDRRRALVFVSRIGRATGARAWRISFWTRIPTTATRNICRHFW